MIAECADKNSVGFLTHQAQVKIATIRLHQVQLVRNFRRHIMQMHVSERIALQH
jgi:hypothetical protein